MGERWAGPAWATTPVPATDGTVLFLDCSKDGTIVESAQLDTQPFYVLGRNQLVVDLPTEHPSCSRQHAALVHRPDGAVVLVDLDSAQGTFFGDTRLEPNDPVVVETGEPFRLGSSSRTYFLRRGPRPVTPSAGHTADSPLLPTTSDNDHGEAKRKREAQADSVPSTRATDTAPPRKDKARASRWNQAPEEQAAAGASTFGRAEIVMPTAAASTAATAAASTQQEAAAAFIRSHMAAAAAGAGGAFKMPMTAEQKKKLLWGGKKEAAAAPAAPAPAAAGYNRWDAAEFNDGAAQAKFRKLMGVKGVAAAGGGESGSGPEAPPVGVAEGGTAETMALQRQRELQAELESQFYEGRRRQGGGTFGLGR